MDPSIEELDAKARDALLRWRRLAREDGYPSGTARDALADYLALELPLTGWRTTWAEAREAADRITEILLDAAREPL